MDGFQVIICWKGFGVAVVWLFVIVIATLPEEALVEVPIVFALAPKVKSLIEREVSSLWSDDWLYCTSSVFQVSSVERFGRSSLAVVL